MKETHFARATVLHVSKGAKSEAFMFAVVFDEHPAAIEVRHFDAAGRQAQALLSKSLFAFYQDLDHDGVPGLATLEALNGNATVMPAVPPHHLDDVAMRSVSPECRMKAAEMIDGIQMLKRVAVSSGDHAVRRKTFFKLVDGNNADDDFLLEFAALDTSLKKVDDATGRALQMLKSNDRLLGRIFAEAASDVVAKEALGQMSDPDAIEEAIESARKLDRRDKSTLSAAEAQHKG